MTTNAVDTPILANADNPNNSDGDPLANVADDLVSQMSSPNENAISGGIFETQGIDFIEENSESGKTEFQFSDSNIKDRYGNPFNPKFHKTKANGEPSVTKKGNCQLKPSVTPEMVRAGSVDANHEPTKSAYNSVIGSNDNTNFTESATAQMPCQTDPQAEAFGEAMAMMIVSSAQIVGGEEWAPMADKNTGLNEFQNLKQSFTAYGAATGATEIPPWVGIGISLTAYAAPRFTMPKTQNRMKKVKAWCAGLWSKWVLKNPIEKLRTKSDSENKEE